MHVCVSEVAVPPGERVSGGQVSGVRVAGEADKSILRQLVGQLSDEKRHLQAERDALEAEVEQLKESAQVWWAVLEYYIWLRPVHLSCMRVFGNLCSFVLHCRWQGEGEGVLCLAGILHH